jgi:hypothetical protein
MIRLGVGGARKKEAGEDLRSSITESCFFNITSLLQDA